MARARIDAGAVAIPDWAVESLVSRAARGGECRGHRARRFARRGSRAPAAALRGADRVGRQDLRVAVELAIRPRDTVDVLEDDAPEEEEGRDEETPDVPDVPDVPKNEKAEEDAGDRDRDDQSDSDPSERADEEGARPTLNRPHLPS